MRLTTKGAAHQAKIAPECGGEEREHGVFHEDELYEAPATGSDGDAEGHLAGAGCGLRGHEVGDVGAGDQQHESDEDAEPNQSAAVIVLQAWRHRKQRAR